MKSKSVSIKPKNPIVRLASFAKFIGQYKERPEIIELVKERFLAFLDATVCRYKNFENIPVDFVGSIGFFFREILEVACRERKVSLGTIVKDPIDMLVAAHIRQLKEEKQLPS